LTYARLIEALTGRFDDNHAELARMLLDQIDGLNRQIDTLTTRIEQLIADPPGTALKLARAYGGDGYALLAAVLRGVVPTGLPEASGPSR
jgi:transposase